MTGIPASPDPLLTIDSLVSGYGDLQVLRGVSLAVPAGSVTLVLGRNGAGKTTLMAATAGLLRAWSGSVSLAGQDVTKLPPYARTQAGIALVLEGKRIFRQRPVDENLHVGAYPLRLRRAQLAERTEAVLAQIPALADLRRRTAGSLSGGQQQMLAIGQALMSDPKALLLDEPSAGLAPAILDTVLEIIDQLRRDGRAIVLVEQIIERVIDVADHVAVIDDGEVQIEGPRSAFATLDALESAYFGRAAGNSPGR
jgi:branched-chain amino acid transport system ATP-binding protein